MGCYALFLFYNVVVMHISNLYEFFPLINRNYLYNKKFIYMNFLLESSIILVNIAIYSTNILRITTDP